MVQRVKVAAVAPGQGGSVEGEVSSHLFKVGLVKSVWEQIVFSFKNTAKSVLHNHSHISEDLLVKLVGHTKEASSSKTSRSLEEGAAGDCCHGGSENGGRLTNLGCTPLCGVSMRYFHTSG